jgi:hypothetical protein
MGERIVTASSSVEPQLASIVKSERHMRSEYGTGMVGVMETVGAHPHFVMPLQPGNVAILSGWDTIDTMYKASVENAVPKASRVLSQLATDWYVFIENVPTRFWIAQGKPLTAQTVTMFVTDDANGITGEYAWERRYPAEPDGDGSQGVPLPERGLANLENHEKLLDAICAGDGAALSALLEPACIWAQRDYLSDVEGGALTDLRAAADAAAHVVRWHAAMQPQHVSIINRRVTDWYVFSEELWLVRPGGGAARQCRTATIYPLGRAGRFEAVLGFGRDIEEPSPSSGSKLGRAFWTEPGVAIGDVARS